MSWCRVIIIGTFRCFLKIYLYLQLLFLLQLLLTLFFLWTMPSLVSGPFNIHHGVNVTHSSPNNEENRVNASVVVCVCRFDAEYSNELSASPGDIFKVSSPDIVNGWLLAQSLSTGQKGWVPHHNLTPYDVFSDKNNNNEKKGPPLPYYNETPRATLMTPSLSANTRESSLSSNSLLDYYTNDASSSISSIISSNQNSPYTSLYVHSMFSVNASFCYRIDLSTSTTSTFHIARYYSDIKTLHSYLSSIIFSMNASNFSNSSSSYTSTSFSTSSHSSSSSSKLILPTLPNPIMLDPYHSVENLSESISMMNNYLQKVFKMFNNTSNQSLHSALALFLTPSGNDFQHYAELSDEQIWKILKPNERKTSSSSSSSSNSNSYKSIELTDLKSDSPLPSPDSYLSPRSFSFSKPSIKKSSSMMSINSKISNTSTMNSSTTLSTNQNRSSSTSTTLTNSSIRVKITYKDEYSLLKLDLANLSFNVLSDAISSKIKHTGPLTFAYKNENNIFVLLRDDIGLNKALACNNKKMVIKVI